MLMSRNKGVALGLTILYNCCTAERHYPLFFMELTLREQIDAAKKQLHEAQTAYLHAFASNRMEDIAKHKRTVGKLTREIGQLVRYKLDTGIE